MINDLPETLEFERDGDCSEAVAGPFLYRVSFAKAKLVTKALGQRFEDRWQATVQREDQLSVLPRLRADDPTFPTRRRAELACIRSYRCLYERLREVEDVLEPDTLKLTNDTVPFDQLSDGEQRQLNKPTPERIRQGFAEQTGFRSQEQKVFDSVGRHVFPVGRMVDLLDRWLRAEDITQGQYEAGMLYQELVQQAGKHFSPSCDPGRIPTGGGDPEAGMVRAIDKGSDAYEAYLAMAKASPKVATAVQLVLGEGMKLMDYAVQYCRAKCHRTAKDRIHTGLDILSTHWKRDEQPTRI